jgi:hypothetical protein
VFGVLIGSAMGRMREMDAREVLDWLVVWFRFVSMGGCMGMASFTSIATMNLANYVLRE